MGAVVVVAELEGVAQQSQGEGEDKEKDMGESWDLHNAEEECSTELAQV